MRIKWVCGISSRDWPGSHRIVPLRGLRMKEAACLSTSGPLGPHRDVQDGKDSQPLKY